MNRTRTLTLSAGCLLALSVAAFCCVDHKNPSVVPDPAASAGAETASASSSPARPAAGDASAPAPRPDPPRKPATVQDPVARSMEQHDARDRALLSDLERITHRPPPSAILELLELRRQGKTRAELERFIADELSADLAVRAAVARWLRAGDGPEAPAGEGVAPGSSLGRGGNPRRIAPLEKKAQPN